MAPVNGFGHVHQHEPWCCLKPPLLHVTCRYRNATVQRFDTRTTAQGMDLLLPVDFSTVINRRPPPYEYVRNSMIVGRISHL